LEQTIALARANGFEGISIEQGEIAEVGGPAVAARLLAASGLRAANAGLPVDFRTTDEAFERGLGALPAYAADLVTLGCDRVATWLLPASDTLPYEENLALHRDRLGAAAAVLGRSGIRLGLEYVGPLPSRAGKRYPFIYDQAGLFALIEAMGQPNVGILLDAWHWYTTGSNLGELAALSNESVVLVHVNDAPAGVAVTGQQDLVRRMPGETGVIDIAAFMQALADMSYDGPVVVEPFSDRVRALAPAEAVQATAASLARIWP
jgi:sugar phosphate isomerase/epimerase